MRKHRLAERLLVDVIGLEWHKVHREAGRWEHVISDDVEARLVELLGRPGHLPARQPDPGVPLAGSVGPGRDRWPRWTPASGCGCSGSAKRSRSNLGSLTLLDEGGFIPGVVADGRRP